MRRVRMLVAMALLTAAMLMLTSTAAAARPIICPDGTRPCGGRCLERCPTTGVPVPETVCVLLVDENEDGIFEWRPGGVCWVNWGAAVSGF